MAYHLVFWALPTGLLEGFDKMLYLPALTTALLNNKFVIAVITHRNFQTSLCFSVLDRSFLGIKPNTTIKAHFFFSKQTDL